MVKGAGSGVGNEEFLPSLTGLRVRLVSVESGALYDGEVFSDGSLFVFGVAAGTYNIEFDKKQLASRKLCTDILPMRFTLNKTNRTIMPATLVRCGG